MDLRKSEKIIPAVFSLKSLKASVNSGIGKQISTVISQIDVRRLWHHKKLQQMSSLGFRFTQKQTRVSLDCVCWAYTNIMTKSKIRTKETRYNNLLIHYQNKKKSSKTLYQMVGKISNCRVCKAKCSTKVTQMWPWWNSCDFYVCRLICWCSHFKILKDSYSFKCMEYWKQSKGVTLSFFLPLPFHSCASSLPLCHLWTDINFQRIRAIAEWEVVKCHWECLMDNTPPFKSLLHLS